MTVFQDDASWHAVRPGHLAHVDVTLGVRRDAVGRDKCTRGAAIGAAPTEQHVSGEIEHEDATREIVRAAPPSEVRGARWPPQRGDVDQPLLVYIDIRWPLDMIPDLEQLATQSEYLDAVVLPVGHEHAFISDPDAMRDVE